MIILKPCPEGAKKRGSDKAIKRHKSEIHHPKSIILRHDVDARPLNSLRTARLEHSLGINGTYYFRIGPKGFNEEIIRKIAALGHEIEYHYETMAQAGKRLEAGSTHFLSFVGKIKTLCKSVSSSVQLCVNQKHSNENQILHHAYKLFTTYLRKLRRITPVSTICPHGSPHYPFEKRLIWMKYDFRELGIAGDATLDTDFSEVAYFTDTGRRWDGHDESVRDKLPTGESPFPGSSGNYRPKLMLLM